MSSGGARPNSGRKSTHNRPGLTLTVKGYWRFCSGPFIWKLEHRVIMQKLIQETTFGWWADKQEIPPNFTVEHLDHVRRHNCVSNLLLLDKCIHDAISFASWDKIVRRSWEVSRMAQMEEPPF